MASAISSVVSAAGAGSSSASLHQVLPSGGAAEAASAPFADLITSAVGQVDQLQQQADATVRGLMDGSGVDVHQAMIATEKASMAFELALAVRNKAVQAYQAVMGMQF